jgi:hypothetical protein
MDDLTATNPIHFYDTTTHRIACGVSGSDHRSTKHPRQVTCQACVALIGERATAATAPRTGGEPSAAGMA